MGIAIGQSVVFTDGWFPIADALTYASATTINVPAGSATNRYQVGDKLWLTNSGNKYLLITTVAASLLTVTGGDSYSVANAAITAPFFSRADRPYGFPPYFPYTPTLTGFSANPASAIYRFSVVGGFCNVHVYQGNAGTSNTTGFTISSPFTAYTLANDKWGVTSFIAADNGVILGTPAVASIASGASTIVCYKTTVDTAASWTAANGKLIGFDLRFPIAGVQ